MACTRSAKSNEGAATFEVVTLKNRSRLERFHPNGVGMRRAGLGMLRGLAFDLTSGRYLVSG